MDFRLGFSLQGFCVLYFTLPEFPTKDVLECIVNPTYLIGYCNCTLINLFLKTIVLIFNTTHKMECCECCYWLGWYNLWRVKSGSLNYSVLWFSCFNNTWLSESFSFLSRYELLLIEHFLFYFSIFILICIFYLNVYISNIFKF